MKTTEQEIAIREARKNKLEDERRRRWAELGDMDIMTVGEVATMMGMCSRTIYSLAMDNKIPGTKVGTQWRFSRKILTEFIQGRRDCHGQEISLKQPSRVPVSGIRDSFSGRDQQGASRGYPSLSNQERLCHCQEKESAA